MPAKQTKDTVYVDAEDEITAIIEKVRNSESKIVALVLPKRSQALQSIVNLKLLKRTSTQAKKNLVLITSDQNLLPIAGAVGMFVAKTPQSKPEIPAATKSNQSPDTISIIDNSDDSVIDKSVPIGELAGVETIELGDVPGSKSPSGESGKSKRLFNKKLKVPDFNKFRLLLICGILLIIILIVGGVYATVILPKAKIIIKTDTASVVSDLTFIAKTDVTEPDLEKLIIPAVKKELKKSEVQKVPTTGQKNNGEKATGEVALKNCTASDGTISVPAGSPLTSSNLTFVTTVAITLPQSVFTGGGTCITATKTVKITAEGPGDNYNLSSRSYSLTGFSGVNGTGNDMTGGTNKLVQVVSKSDVDKAKDKLLEKLNAASIGELKAQIVADNLLPLDDTYAGSDPTVVAAPNINDEASEVTVTVTVTYSELGVSKDHIKSFIEENVNKQIDTTKQTIQDNGLDKATIRVLDKKSADEVTFSVSTISIAGPQLDADGIKREIVGKKKSQTIDAIKSRPGIQDVEVNYSPFWVYSTPKRINSITITFEQDNE